MLDPIAQRAVEAPWRSSRRATTFIETAASNEDTRGGD